MNMENRTHRKNHAQSGTTLVELVVTFALLGIFLTAVTSMLTSTIQIFTRMHSTSQAILVSDMLLDKITGEIDAANLPKATSQTGYYFWLQPTESSEDGKSRWVVFNNRSDSPVAIFAAPQTADGKANIEEMGSGELFMRYYSLSEENDAAAAGEFDWRIDSKAYMGYQIESLRFSDCTATGNPNVVRIDLTLRHTRTGFTYTTFRYAENYNYDPASNYMCQRTDIEPETTSFPLAAEEFRIRGSGDGGGENPDPENPTEPEEPDPGEPETGNFTVYYVSETGKVLGTTLYPNAVAGTSFWVTAQYFPGYTIKGDGSVSVSYTDSNTSHTFYYKPNLQTYTVLCYQRNGNPLLSPYYGQVETDVPIEIVPPVITGYVPEQEKYTYTATGNNVGGNQVWIYYTPKMIPITVHYTWNGYKIAEDTKVSVAYNTSGYWLAAQDIPGYTKESYGVSLNVLSSSSQFDSETETMEYTFTYVPSSSTAPFQPAGTKINIGVSGSEPDELDQKLARALFEFFYEPTAWKTETYNNWLLEDWFYYRAGYRTFTVDRTTYGIAGYMVSTPAWYWGDNTLTELVSSQNFIRIETDITNKLESKEPLMKYLLLQAGASDSEIKTILEANRNYYFLLPTTTSISFSFNSSSAQDGTVRYLQSMTYKRADGKTVTITFQ